MPLVLVSLCRNTRVSTSPFSPWGTHLAPCSTWLAARSGASWRAGCCWCCPSCTCPAPCTSSCCSASRTFSTKGSSSSPALPFCADVPPLPVQSVLYSSPLPLTPSCLATSAPCAEPAAVSQSQPALCCASCTCFGAFCLSRLIQTDSRLTKGGMGIREFCGTRSKDTAWITGLVVGYQIPYPKAKSPSLY